MMVRVSGVEWLRLPETPVTDSVKVPVDAADEADSVSTDDALPPAVGVRLDGVNTAVTPPGNPDTPRLVALLKLFTLPTVTDTLPLAP